MASVASHESSRKDICGRHRPSTNRLRGLLPFSFHCYRNPGYQSWSAALDAYVKYTQLLDTVANTSLFGVGIAISALLGFIAGLLVYLELILRAILVAIAVPFIPLAAAFTALRGYSQFLGRLVHGLMTLILLKMVDLLVLIIGFGWALPAKNNPIFAWNNYFIGLGTTVLLVFTPFMIYSLLGPLSDGSAQLVAMTKQALVMTAMMMAARRQSRHAASGSPDSNRDGGTAVSAPTDKIPPPPPPLPPASTPPVPASQTTGPVPSGDSGNVVSFPSRDRNTRQISHNLSEPSTTTQQIPNSPKPTRPTPERRP